MNIFVYDESAHAIYLHTARSGRTRANIEAEPRVCFVTVGAMVKDYVEHVDHHLKFMLEKRARLGKPLPSA